MNTAKCLQMARHAMLPLVLGLIAACTGDAPARDRGEQASATQSQPVGVNSGDSALVDIAGLYAAQCASCHGEQGQGNVAMQAPQLAGQQVEYTARQLRHFANGLRGSAEDDAVGASMAIFAQNLEREYFEPLANYLSRLAPSPAPRASIGEDLLANGKRAYQSRCGSCHGYDAAGIAAMKAPALAGMSADYLQRQLRNYRSGVRGAAQGDLYGAQMRAMVGTLRDDAELEAVAGYLSTL